jgi:quercetin dioxygenase-like cupin family protein
MTPPGFSVRHASDGFTRDGLRPFYEYRDLGIAEATGGQAMAHVIRAIPGQHASAPKHTHTLSVQIVYVTRGWVTFWYEGVGEVRLEAGSCVHQPSGIVHQETGHSDDLEMLEITVPASFETKTAE